MKKSIYLVILSMSLLICSASQIFGQDSDSDNYNDNDKNDMEKNEFQYYIEQFADIKIMRYKVTDFELLNNSQQMFIYYLNEAALWGDQITWDQNYKHNLTIRAILQNIYTNYNGKKTTKEWAAFEVYVKRVMFSKGIHHHYSKDKFFPEIDELVFVNYMQHSPNSNWPLKSDETLQQLINRIIPIIYSPDIAPKAVCIDSDKDMIVNSASNFYEGVTQAEVEEFYYDKSYEQSDNAVSIGLNSKVVKSEDGEVQEKVYKVDGMYSEALKMICVNLEKAQKYAESEIQKKALYFLISYYETGNLEDFDNFNISWLSDIEPQVDYVNGFTETYDDPMDRKASWESLVNFRNDEASERTYIISKNAQWFEDNSPVDSIYKKEIVKGVSAKVINATILSGATYPSPPIGINLPNSDWIRAEYGSKSVSIENITNAYTQAALQMKNNSLSEFAYTEDEQELEKEYGSLGSNLHTDLHECLGHGSGKLAPNVKSDALKNYGSAIEEARADLFALYYIMDPHMVELGVMPNLDVAKAEYNSFIRNGIMLQLRRIELGKTIEQAHMRDRALIANWAFELGNESIIERVDNDGKTYFVITNYEELRTIFGVMLTEIQRIKSTGDYEAAKGLIEKYAVNIDPSLHAEVIDRYKALNIAPYGGFINPEYKLSENEDGETKVEISYPTNFLQQVFDYKNKYFNLPYYN